MDLSNLHISKEIDNADSHIEVEQSVGSERGHNQVPSRVIYIGHLGDNVQESDLEDLFQDFGEIEKVVMMHSRHQALIQMEDIASATAAVEHFQQSPPYELGRNITVEVSSHQELNRNKKKSVRSRGDNISTAYDGERRNKPSHPINRILLIKIHNPIWPITTDVLYQVFARYGSLEKIVIFVKNTVLQAFIQFESEKSAENAKNTVDGQNIYPGGCTLAISFSTVDDLNVKENSLRTKDYLNPNLPVPVVDAPLNPYDNSQQMGRSHRMPQQKQQQHGILGTRPGSLLHIPTLAVDNSSATRHPMPNLDHTNSRPQEKIPPAPFSQGTPVLLVCGLDPEKATCDALFNLFSCFGNITRIKKLHNKTDHALIQMANHTSAVSAIAFLRGCHLFGKPLEIRLSKHPYINAASSHDEENHNMKDYSGSSLNRFIGKYANSTKYICSPTKTLHVSNLIETLSEGEIAFHFSQFGQFEQMKTLSGSSGGHLQALFQFSHVGAATDVLALAHNSVLAGKKLRVAFSKNIVAR